MCLCLQLDLHDWYNPYMIKKPSEAIWNHVEQPELSELGKATQDVHELFGKLEKAGYENFLRTTVEDNNQAIGYRFTATTIGEGNERGEKTIEVLRDPTSTLLVSVRSGDELKPSRMIVETDGISGSPDLDGNFISDEDLTVYLQATARSMNRALRQRQDALDWLQRQKKERRRNAVRRAGGVGIALAVLAGVGFGIKSWVDYSAAVEEREQEAARTAMDDSGYELPPNEGQEHTYIALIPEEEMLKIPRLFENEVPMSPRIVTIESEHPRVESCTTVFLPDEGAQLRVASSASSKAVPAGALVAIERDGLGVQVCVPSDLIPGEESLFGARKGNLAVQVVASGE